MAEVRHPPPAPSSSSPRAAPRKHPHTPAPSNVGGSRAPSALSQASGGSFVSRDSEHGAGKEELRALQQATPVGWKVYMSNTHGKPYWYNKRTRETRWVQPLAEEGRERAGGGRGEKEAAGRSVDGDAGSSKGGARGGAQGGDAVS
eukprot:556071-Rhodomonas_salina.1